MMGGDGSDAGNGLAFGNPDITLTEVHIILLECQHLTDTHAGVKQYQHRINAEVIAVCPEPINLLATEWVVRTHGFIFPYR